MCPSKIANKPNSLSSNCFNSDTKQSSMAWFDFPSTRWWPWVTSFLCLPFPVSGLAGVAIEKQAFSWKWYNQQNKCLVIYPYVIYGKPILRSAHRCCEQKQLRQTLFSELKKPQKRSTIKTKYDLQLLKIKAFVGRSQVQHVEFGMEVLILLIQNYLPVSDSRFSGFHHQQYTYLYQLLLNMLWFKLCLH